MKRLLMFVLVIKSVFSEDCTGKITGIPCISSKDIVKEFEPSINELKNKISTASKMVHDRTAATKILIISNIADAKNLTHQLLVSNRNLLNQAKLEALKASLRIRACVTSQSVEFAKITTGDFIKCNGDFSTLQGVKSDILKLQQIVIGLINSCLHLNPLRKEISNLRVCFDQKIKDVKLQLILVEKEFEDWVKTVVNLSTDCVMRVTGKVYEKVGEVLGAVKNCKNF